MTRREAVLAALEAALLAQGLVVVRNPTERISVDPELLAQRDGDPGEPEVTLSPYLETYEHEAAIEVYAIGDEAVLDRLLERVRYALTVAGRLGGLLDEPLTWGAPLTEFERPPGTEDLSAARLPVVLPYTVTDALAA